MEPELVIVVDDEPSLRHVIQRKLASKGCNVEVAETAEACLSLVEKVTPAVILLDIILPGRSGLEVLGELKQKLPDTEVIIMTSHASLETAIRAIREGAYDYLQKPFDDLEDVWITIQRAMEKRALTLRNQALIEEKEQRNRDLGRAVARLTSMVAAARRIAEISSMQELLDTFLERLSKNLDVNRASLLLVDEGKRQLWLASHIGLDHLIVEETRIELGHGIAGKVAETGEPFLVEDLRGKSAPIDAAHPDLSNSFISAPIALSIPLKSSQKVLGVVNLTNRTGDAPFDSDDLNYILALSSYIAVAIEKVRQIEALEQAYNNLKSTQDQLVCSERLRVVGQMAAGVAHDFNNLLAVVLGRAQLAQMMLNKDPDPEKLREYLKTIQDTSMQGAQIIRRLQNYTRVGDASDAPMDINAVVKSAVEMTRPKWKDECDAESRPIRFEFRLEETSAVFGNVNEMSQAIGNLIFNAVEAMPEGGCITFSTRQENGRVTLEIADTGIGMSADTQAQVFQPLFTTKPEGQGLGTSVACGIVRRHNGEIGVTSVEGQGTTYTLQLPVMEKPKQVEATEAEAGAAIQRNVRVLLVDDDDKVRRTFEEALQANGHHVLEAQSGRRALELFDESEIDIVITDLSMDGMSGLEVATAVKDRNPSIPVVLLSGWAANYVNDNVKSAGVDHVLEKPCLIETLLNKVQEAIQEPGKA